MRITNEYIDGDLKVTEYENGNIVKVPKDIDFTPGDHIPVLDDPIKRLEEQNADLNLQIIELWETLIGEGIV